MVLVFIAACTISDIYYKKLRREYAFLTNDLPVEGIITDYKVLWRYSYITLNSSKKICVQPIGLNAHAIQYFDDSIEIGDSILKNEDSDEIVLKKKGTDFLFINRKYDP